MDPITGMTSAVEVAKNAGVGSNMTISSALVIEMAERIYRLESADHVWETTMMRLVGEDGPADVGKAIDKLKAQTQQTTIDQFAMAALPVAHEQVQELSEATLKRIIGKGDSLLPITGENVRQAVAITAYMMAEAMQAESRKRQGGAV